MAWRLTQRRILLPGLVDKIWYLGEWVHRWWDGPFMRRVLIAPPRDIFWGRELVGEELNGAKRGYPFEDFLEGPHFSYMMTLVPQLIDVVVSEFVPPPQADPSQPLCSRAGATQASQGHSASRVASSDHVHS